MVAFFFLENRLAYVTPAGLGLAIEIDGGAAAK
jgi:hypothetical protein